jgi:hypothetical protein
MFASWRRDVSLYSVMTFAILSEVCNSVNPRYCLFLVEIHCFLRFWKRYSALAKELLEIGYGLEFVTFLRNWFWSSCLFTWWDPVFRTAVSREYSSLVPWKLYCQRQHNMELRDCSVEMQVCIQLNLLTVLYIWGYDSSMYLFLSVLSAALFMRNVWLCAALRDYITEC